MKLNLTARELRAAVVDTVPVMTGYIALGIGFGVILRTRGFGPGWALFMSVTMLSGSLQYVAVELMSGGVSLLATAMTALAVNARHLFYGISMLDRYKNAGAKKYYLALSLTDETYSLVSRETLPVAEEKRADYCLVISALDHLYWIIGCVTGALLGAVLPFSTEGIDFVLTALFVTIFVDQWCSARDHAPALVGLIGAAACLGLFGSDSFLIPAMLVILVGLLLLRKKEVRHD